MGQVDAIGTDIHVAGSFDHRPDIAGGFSAEGAGGNASAAESAAGRITAPAVTTVSSACAAAWRVLTAASTAARAIRIGHGPFFLNFWIGHKGESKTTCIAFPAGLCRTRLVESRAPDKQAAFSRRVTATRHVCIFQSQPEDAFPPGSRARESGDKTAADNTVVGITASEANNLLAFLLRAAPSSIEPLTGRT